MAPATKGTQTVLGGLSGIGLGLLKVTIHGAACVDADERRGLGLQKNVLRRDLWRYKADICACLLKSLLASVEGGKPVACLWLVVKATRPREGSGC